MANEINPTHVGLIQETNPKDPAPLPGKQIDTDKWQGRNYHLNMMAQIISMNMMHLMKCPSNNMSGEVTPRCARGINANYAYLEYLWKSAKRCKNAPHGTLEAIITVQVPELWEVQAMRNQKLLPLMQHYFLAAQILNNGVEVSKAPCWIGDAAEKDIDDIMLMLKRDIADLVGDGQMVDGSDPENPKYNTGIPRPDYAVVGRVKPLASLSSGIVAEPSKDFVPGNYPDAPDRPVDGE